VQSFELQDGRLASDGSIAGTVILSNGTKLCKIHQVILCTGYHVSFPFMRQYHADGMRPEDADDQVLVTDGQVTHNLHKDIWYIPDPTLAFIGVPYHTATYTAFEFQTMAIAKVFSGAAVLPTEAGMRAEYKERVQQKGAGRTLHSLRDYGQEPEYVSELADAVNATLPSGSRRMMAHSQRWLDAYEVRRKRMTAFLGGVRDPKIDQRVLAGFVWC
jgi:hypothetical protein